MATDRVLIGWGYLVELILAVLLYAAAATFRVPSDIPAFILKTGSSWTSTLEVLLALSGALLIAVVANLFLTDFGKFLSERGAGGIYMWAYGSVALIFLISTVALKLTSWSQADGLLRTAFIMLLYSAINSVTLIKNTVELAGLLLKHRSHKEWKS